MQLKPSFFETHRCILEISRFHRLWKRHFHVSLCSRCRSSSPSALTRWDHFSLIIKALGKHHVDSIVRFLWRWSHGHRHEAVRGPWWVDLGKNEQNSSNLFDGEDRKGDTFSQWQTGGALISKYLRRGLARQDIWISIPMWNCGLVIMPNSI